MYTCRTCKLLKHTQAKREFAKGHNGELYEYFCEADSIIDVLAEWHILREPDPTTIRATAIDSTKYRKNKIFK